MSTSFVEFINRQCSGAGMTRWPLNIAAAFNDDLPPLDFVMPGLLAGTVGALVAPGGLGKSMLSLQLSAMITSGADLMGLGTFSTGPVAYLSAEDPDCILSLRLKALGQHLTSDQKKMVDQNLFLMPVTGLHPNLLSEAWTNALEAVASEHRLVILDTLRRFHTADENSGAEMAALIARMESIVATTGSSLLFIHHTNKNALSNAVGDQQQASRGSSVLVDNIRWQGYLIGMSSEEAKRFGIPEMARHQYLRFGVSKTNYAARPVDKWLIRSSGGVLKAADLAPIAIGQRKMRRVEI